MGIDKRVVGIIGVGHVGAHVAFTLGMTGTADEVLLYDLDERRLKSEWQDLMDAVKFMPHRVTYYMASFNDLGRCDIIVNSIGPTARYVTENRNDEMKYTVAAVAQYMPQIRASGFAGIIVNITNPCDVVTQVISDRSGLPRKCVLGTGTGLDTARLVNQLVERTGIAHASVTAYMMGEHGFAQMTPWSLARFGGKALEDMADDPVFAFDREEVVKAAIDAGWLVYSGKLSTEYGICSTAVDIIRTIFHDERKILAASVFLNGEYGEEGIYCGCPAVLGADGVEQVLEYRLTEAELAAFKTCCAEIRANIGRAEALLQQS